MSGNLEEEKNESSKSYPLDLASKLNTLKSDGKPPLIIQNQPLRTMRLVTHTTPTCSGQSGAGGSALITTSIVSQAAAIKQGEVGSNRAQLTGIVQSQLSGNIQRPAQITLATPLPIIGQNSASGTTYHVPRGPAVVASLSAPRSTVATAIRAPMAVSGQTTGQIKGTPAVFSPPLRNASVTNVGGKPQIVTRPQIGQVVSTIRPTTAILHSAIIGQGQIHQLKPAPQSLNTTVTLAQVLPNRTQTLVYNTGSPTHFSTSPRITVSTTASGQKQQLNNARPMAQVTATRLAVPVTQPATRIVPAQNTVIPGARITTVPTSQQPTVIGSTSTRILSTTQANVPLGRLTVTVTNASTTNNHPLLSQLRSTIAMHPIVAATNTSHSRTMQTQGKFMTQPQQVNSHNASVTTRPVAGVQSIPVAKVYPQQGEAQQVVAPTNVFIQTPLTSRSSPGPLSLTQPVTTVQTTNTTYSAASYMYDPAGNYSIPRNFGQQPSSFAISQSCNTQRPNPVGTQVHGIVPNQSMRFNQIVVVESNRAQVYTQEPLSDNMQSAQTPTKMTSSPRPSILRKRDHDGSPLKAVKNLIPALTNLQQQQQMQQNVQQPPASPPSRPDSRNNGLSSGSTTISATSSPGLADGNEDSNPHMPMNKEEEENRPPHEMSPRKKPRKQNLAGNEMDENNDMQFISEKDIKKENDDSDAINSDIRDGNDYRRLTVTKPATASLLNGYRQTWKTTHNHFQKYSEVRPKEERRPSIMDLANQHGVLDKVNGWKIHHLSTQMEDLADQEQSVHIQLTELLKVTESKEHNNELNSINELIKGNLQRIKIINDGMVEAKAQIMSIFDHKVHVADIIARCASKRNYKKREKS